MKFISKKYLLDTLADSLTFGAAFLIVFTVAGLVEFIMKIVVSGIMFIYPGFADSLAVEIGELFKILVYLFELVIILAVIVRVFLRTACDTYQFEFCKKVTLKGV